MDLHEVVREIVGRQVVDVTAVGGGDSGAASLVRLDDGAVFTKTAASAEQAQAEEAGLRWLAEAQAVAVPAVLGRREALLVLSHIEVGEPTAEKAEVFGRELAELHAAGAPAHGYAPPGSPSQSFIGLAPMRNEPEQDWPSFFASQRIEPYLRSAADNNALTASEVGAVEQVLDRVDVLAGAVEPPARLHGDLWHGNVLWGQRSAHLVDPAAHGGHRETDLAMLQLFGCPQLDRILAAYHEVRPLAEGWRSRIGLHQLFPLLVHTALFGRSYAAQVVAAARGVLDGELADAGAVPRRDVVTALREQIQADLQAVSQGVPEGALGRTKGHVRGLLDALVLALEAEVGRPVTYAETRSVLSGQVSVEDLRNAAS